MNPIYKEPSNHKSDNHKLNDHEIERYARQIVMPEIGEVGQQKLRASRVAIVGAGGLGTPVIAGLAGAGVGSLTIIDDDIVEITNLNRQLIYTMNSLSKPKAASAADFVRALNPDINIVTQNKRLTAETIALLDGHDLVMDCSDNFETRYLINDFCHEQTIPFIFGGATRNDGQIASFLPDKTGNICLRCIFPQIDTDYDQTPNCLEAGIIGSTTMIIGSLQTAEAIKILAGFGTSLIRRLLLYDGAHIRFTEITTTAQPDCPFCVGG